MTKNKDFKLEKAFMAVKAQRYEEAMTAYESSLEKSESVEGWTGLGICKLFQLLGNQTMDEVIYCFNKAKNVEGANVKEIEIEMISYSTLVIEQGANYCINLIDEIVKAEKEAANNLIVAGIATAVAINSNSSFTSSLIAGTVAGAAGGVAIGTLAEVQNAKQAGQVTLNMIDEVTKGLSDYLIETKESENAKKLNQRVTEIKSTIVEKSNTASLSNKWYNTWVVWLWLILFWPVGVYGLIKRYSK
jgi:hypothetical protein